MSGGDGVTIDSVLTPCVGCGTPTKIRVHGVAAHFAHAPATAPRTKAGDIRMSFLSDLHKDFAPLCKNNGKMTRPYFQPPMPAAIDDVVSIGWAWERPHSVVGGLAVLDRTAAYLSAAASVEVAHSALVHRSGESSYRGLPGIYKVIYFPWGETSVPHPLGAGEPGTEMWVTHPRAQLLQRLADQGRYPDGFITDAYTCATDQTGKPQAVRLKKWTDHVQEVRRQVITEYGRYDPQQSDGQTEQYRKVKTRFSQARTMMIGKIGRDGKREWDPSCLIHRPDWGMAIADQSACTLWSWCDDLAQIAATHGNPEYGPVAMRNIDEIVIPLVALELLTTTRRDSNRGPIPIDPEGIKLGTFKVKKVTA